MYCDNSKHNIWGKNYHSNLKVYGQINLLMSVFAHTIIPNNGSDYAMFRTNRVRQNGAEVNFPVWEPIRFINRPSDMPVSVLPTLLL